MSVAGGGTPERSVKRLLIAGHSLTFAAPLALQARRAGVEVREDLWPTHRAGDEAASAEALAWADTVLCEWCLGNAAWYSRNKRPGQRLVVRFHRMELETPHPAALALERIDALVFVARHVLEQACERFGWDADDPRLLVVPNAIEPTALAAPKLPGAELTLAMVGYVPRLKRLDLALDVLDLLRARDNRWRLLVKGRPPWEYEWMDRAAERPYFAEQLRRVERAPNLRRAVSFLPFGGDVPAFLREARYILSTSEVEGHSLAVAEGMASAAAPIVLERSGATEQYEERWVHPDADSAALWTLSVREAGKSREEGEAAARFAAERWSWERIWPVWDRLLLREPAAGGRPVADTAAAVV